MIKTPVDTSPQAVLRRRYKALRDEGYNHEFCNFAKVAADRIDALEVELNRVREAYNLMTLTAGDAKLQRDKLAIVLRQIGHAAMECEP